MDNCWTGYDNVYVQQNKHHLDLKEKPKFTTLGGTRMKKSWKQWMAITCALAMIVSLLPATILAEEGVATPTDLAPIVEPVQETEPAEVSAEEPAEEPTPVPVLEVAEEPVAVATPAPQPAQQEAQPTMAELMQSIAKLTSAVQANAIAQSVIPAGVSNPPSAEDMLAEIIRPSFHQRGE